MEPRLATSVLVGALRQKAEAQGGFAAVIARGDPTSGTVLIQLEGHDGSRKLLERLLQPDGRYRWQQTGNQDAENESERQKFLDRRRKYDPDLWILELSIPSAERFAAEMTVFD